jgi:hypothetical protein
VPLSVELRPETPVHDVELRFGWFYTFEQGKGGFGRIWQLLHSFKAVAVPHHNKTIVLHS